MRTVYLMQVTDENADAVLAALDEAGIAHWEKRSGGLTRFFFAGEWGVRIFVDTSRVDEARVIAEQVIEDR
jgi:hypothetical protein